MPDFVKLGQYSNKVKIAVGLPIIAGLAIVMIKSISLVTSDRYLQLELHYAIASVVNNHLLVFLFSASVIASLLILSSNTDSSNNYMDKLRLAGVFAMIVALIVGLAKSASFIISNEYLGSKMYYLILYSASSTMKGCILASLSGVLFAFVTVRMLRGFLDFVGTNRKSADLVVSAIVVALLIFLARVYWLNRTYIPQSLELNVKNIIVVNSVWLIICIFLGFVLGLLLLKLSRAKLNFSLKLRSPKTLAAVVILLLLSNLPYYFYAKSLKKDLPNLILISIDTLRADHLGSYGYYRNTTPNIDQFASEGVRFANTIVQAPWTLPSHMSILTGLYSSSHGVISRSSKLSDEHLTLSEILQNSGYKTAAFTDGAYLSGRYGYQGFDRYDDTGYHKQRAIEDTYIRASNWLRKNHYKPFFLFLHTYQVHCPYDTPSDYDVYSDKNYQGIVQIVGKCGRYYQKIKPKMTASDYNYVIDKYDGLINYTDHFIGRLFNELKSLGLYDNSIIILTSDHGENFLDHPEYEIDHDELYDVVIKVPLIIRAAELPKGKVIDTQVESIDIMPTVLGLVAIQIPKRVEGESLLELIQKGSYNRLFSFSERFLEPYPDYKMIRSNEWKLLQRSETELELFNLKRDPHERNNLFSDQAEITRSLFKGLSDWTDIQKKRSTLYSTDEIQLDSELTEKLKALGYVN